MQSINAGFQSLRTLLPHHEGEKLSKAAILQQIAEYIYQLEQEKTRLLSQNSQLKRLYSLSQQGLTSPGGGGNSVGGGGQTGGSDDTTSPRLKKKRLISNTFNTNVTSLEITSDMPKAESETTAAPSSGSEMYQQNQTGSSNPTGNTAAAAPSVSDLSKQLINEQELRRSLENRLKSLEMQAASVASNTATTTTFVTTAKPPIPVAVLPTQPLKMEVVNPVGNLKPTEQITVKTTGGPTMKIPGTILLAGKNGISVEVEAMASSLPQAPVAQVSLQPAQTMPAGAAVAPACLVWSPRLLCRLLDQPV